MKNNFLIFALLFIFSCQNNLATKPTRGEIKQIALKGSFSEWRDVNNRIIRQYSISKRKPSPALYLPIISFFMPRYYENYELISVFDDKNKLINEEVFYNQAKVESKFFCNKSASNCLISSF